MLGPLFFFTYLMLTNVVLLNMFLSIVVDAHSRASAAVPQTDDTNVFKVRVSPLSLSSC